MPDLGETVDALDTFSRRLRGHATGDEELSENLLDQQNIPNIVCGKFGGRVVSIRPATVHIVENAFHRFLERPVEFGNSLLLLEVWGDNTVPAGEDSDSVARCAPYLEQVSELFIAWLVSFEIRTPLKPIVELGPGKGKSFVSDSLWQVSQIESQVADDPTESVRKRQFRFRVFKCLDEDHPFVCNTSPASIEPKLNSCGRESCDDSCACAKRSGDIDPILLGRLEWGKRPDSGCSPPQNRAETNEQNAFPRFVIHSCLRILDGILA